MTEVRIRKLEFRLQEAVETILNLKDKITNLEYKVDRLEKK